MSDTADDDVAISDVDDNPVSGPVQQADLLCSAMLCGHGVLRKHIGPAVVRQGGALHECRTPMGAATEGASPASEARQAARQRRRLMEADEACSVDLAGDPIFFGTVPMKLRALRTVAPG